MPSSKPVLISLTVVLLLPFLYIVSRDDNFFFHTNYHHDITVSTRRKDDTSSPRMKDDLLFHFPRWGEEGIQLDHLMSFVLLQTGNDTASTVVAQKSHARFPEVLYVVNHQGVWVSHTLVGKSTWKQALLHRSQPTEQLFTLAWEILQQQKQQQSTNSSSRWKHLGRLSSSSSSSSDGFPFLAWYGDYKSCNYHNWENAYSIPLFTTCAPIACRYAFPIPNYQNRASAQPTDTAWRRVQADYRARYPWSEKKRQLVWRGSLSAPHEHGNSTRWRVVVQAQKEDRVDVGFVSIGHINAGLIDMDWNAANGRKEAISPMQDFQTYIAILDIDGNSWSSRFGELLCYNSIVVKVEPAYVEYIYRDLIPWKHYIPMAGNLSDWNEILDFIFEPQNENTIQRIIQNANQWCAHHLTMNSLATDMLDVWESYISYLEKGNTAWEIEWSKYKTLIFNSGFEMVKL